MRRWERCDLGSISITRYRGHHHSHTAAVLSLQRYTCNGKLLFFPWAMLWMSVGVALELCIEALIEKSWGEMRGLLACVCLLRFHLLSCVIWLHRENAEPADISFCSLVNCLHLCVWQGDEVMFASISAVCCNIALKSSTSAVTPRCAQSCCN